MPAQMTATAWGQGVRNPSFVRSHEIIELDPVLRIGKILFDDAYGLDGGA